MFKRRPVAPNRVGPFGLLQPLADILKLIFKEDLIPAGADVPVYFLAPALAAIVGIAAFAVIPFGSNLNVFGYTVNLFVADINVGLLYIFAMSSLAVYGITLAGWSSNNKYSLLGAVRSAAQMVSYELPMGLALLSVIVVAGTLSLAHRDRVPVETPVVQQVESVANYLSTLFARLKAREAMHRGEAELAAVYDRAPSVMCLFDEHLQIVRANRAATEFARRDSAPTEPLSAGDFFHCPCSAQSEGWHFARPLCQDCELCRAVSQTLLSGQGWQRVRVKKLIPREEKLEEAVVLLSTERIQVGGTTRVLLCLEDVTDTERADEQIRSQAALLEITRDAILVRDFSDRIIYWNEGAHRPNSALSSKSELAQVGPRPSSLMA